MKRCSFVLVMILVVMTLFLAACSSTPDAPAPTVAPKPATAQTPAAAATPATPVQPPVSLALSLGKTYEWKMTSAFPPGISVNASLLQFAKTLEQCTNGALKITVYEGTLGTPTDAWDMTKSNAVQLTFTGDSYNPGRMPLTGLITVPFELPDMETTWLVGNELLKAGYLKELTDNFKVLYFRPVPLQTLFLRNKKVTSLEDFKGLKLRGSSGVHAQTATALGATTVAIPSGEAYIAMDRGIVDGTTSGVDFVLANKIYEASKYALKQPLYGGLLVLVMNKDTWNSLPPELQTLVEQVSQETASAEVRRAVDEEQSLWETLGKKMEVYSISTEELARWRNTTAGVADKYVEEAAAKGYPAKEALQLMRKVIKERSK